jgi:hypothetical protein
MGGFCGNAATLWYYRRLAVELVTWCYVSSNPLPVVVRIGHKSIRSIDTLIDRYKLVSLRFCS